MISVPADAVLPSLAVALCTAGACAPPFVPPDMSHRIVVVDRDPEVMHRRPGKYGPGADRGYECVGYLSKKLHGCPCGYAGDPEQECTCGPSLISRYQKRLSGPLLDRIDIHVEVPRVPSTPAPRLRLGRRPGGKPSGPRGAGQVRPTRRAAGGKPWPDRPCRTSTPFSHRVLQ
jgi:hypothetical protein